MYYQAIKYCFCLSNDPKEAHRNFLLLYSLENYINGAIIQTNRIVRTRKAVWDRFHNIMQQAREGQPILTRPKQDYSSTRLYCDLHFYFTCIGQIHKIMHRLCEMLNDQNLRKVYDKFKQSFPKDIRDNLEHLDERAIGQEKGHPIDITNFDFGNFPGDRFSFGEGEYAVNKETLKTLKDIYQEILDIIYSDYGMKNNDFVLHENMERQHKTTNKLVKRARE